MTGKGALWGVLIFIVLVVGGLLVYADFFGNVRLQETMSELLKVTVSALVGALANQFAK